VHLVLATVFIFISGVLNCNFTKILKGSDKSLLKVRLVIVNLRIFGRTLILTSVMEKEVGNIK
jgi:hypothetical protein